MSNSEYSFLYNTISTSPVFKSWMTELEEDTNNGTIVKTFSVIDPQTVRVIARAFHHQTGEPIVESKTFAWELLVNEIIESTDE